MAETERGTEESEASGLPTPDAWQTAIETLRELLGRDGTVSSLALRQALEVKAAPNARALVVQLKWYNFDEPTEGLEPPSFRWHTHARSFYGEESFRKLQQQQERAAEKAAQETPEPAPEEEDETPPREPRRLRQEESRLGTYIVGAMEDIYQSEHVPGEIPYVFDVHKERPGSEYENVDVLAVHWRSPKCVEIVSIEVKLDFTARLVQQARNYCRFSDRVWVAVPVLADASGVGQALRDYDPMLFDHLIDTGIGLLACRRRPGKSYEVVPVHWPRRLSPDPLEKELFLERYRPRLEEAQVMAPRGRYQYPTL